MFSAVAWQVAVPLGCPAFTLRPPPSTFSHLSSRAPKRRRSSRPLLPARCISCVSNSRNLSHGDRFLEFETQESGVSSDGADLTEERVVQIEQSRSGGVGGAGALDNGSDQSSFTAVSADLQTNVGENSMDEDEEAGPGGLMKDSVLEVKWKEEAERGAAAPSASCSACSQAGGTIQPIADPARFFQFTRTAAPTAWLGGLQPPLAPNLDAPSVVLSSADDEPSVSSTAIVDEPGMGDRGDAAVPESASGHASDSVYKPGPPSLWNIRDESSRTADEVEIEGPVESSADSDAAESVAAYHQRRMESRLANSLPYSPQSLARRMFRYMQAQRNRQEFLKYFRGEFDNYEQVCEQRQRGVLPREGGGHEHIHCSLVQLSDDMLFARYYFNGDPSVVFRSRLYKVFASDQSENGVVEMRIFRFYEETERRLKSSNYDINAISWDNDDIYDWLEGCEVYWERYEVAPNEDDPASRQLGISPGSRFVGYMKGGGCELYSREIDGRIRVMDDLLLTSDDLWVADRGFDESGHFVYGNRRGRPYKMKRVNTNEESNDPAFWTLTSSIPAPEGYEP